MFHVLWGLPFKVGKIEKFLPNFDVLLLLTCFIFIKTKEDRSLFDFLS